MHISMMQLLAGLVRVKAFRRNAQPAPATELFNGDWGYAPTSNFVKKPARDFEAKMQSVYHSALLASFVVLRLYLLATVSLSAPK